MDGSYTDKQPPSWDSVAITYYGGHSYTVDTAEAAALTAAGYGENVTVDSGEFSNNFQGAF